MKPIILETERLQLRPVEVDDYTQLWKGCFINWDVFEGQTSVPLNEKQLWLFLRKIEIDYELERGEKLYWVIVLKSTAEIIGVIDIHGMSLGYNLGVPYRGFGYMTEAAKVVLKYVLLPKNYQYVKAKCKTTNRKSIAVLERCGFSCYGCCTDNYINGAYKTNKYILFKEDIHA